MIYERHFEDISGRFQCIVIARIGKENYGNCSFVSA